MLEPTPTYNNDFIFIGARVVTFIGIHRELYSLSTSEVLYILTNSAAPLWFYIGGMDM